MSAPSSFDSSAALRSLGVNRGADIPSINIGALDQTIIIADLSKSFAQQRFEARGFATAEPLAFAGERSIVQLIVNAPGGAVIERVDIFSEDPGAVPAVQCVFQILPERQILNNLGTALIFDVGGAPTRSVFERGSRIATGPGAVINLDSFGQKTFENFGWFVPSGSALNVLTFSVNFRLSVTMQWRELPQSL